MIFFILIVDIIDVKCDIFFNIIDVKSHLGRFEYLTQKSMYFNFVKIKNILNFFEEF